MQAEPELVARFLSLVALMAATIEYCELLRRRQTSRAVARLQVESAQSGLIGLVRVFAADGE
ncbi:MAG TPA: hypothetical protein VF013_04090 [Candidatus Limnocylindria bacterium]